MRFCGELTTYTGSECDRMILQAPRSRIASSKHRQLSGFCQRTISGPREEAISTGQFSALGRTGTPLFVHHTL